MRSVFSSLTAGGAPATLAALAGLFLGEGVPEGAVGGAARLVPRPGAWGGTAGAGGGSRPSHPRMLASWLTCGFEGSHTEL